MNASKCKTILTLLSFFFVGNFLVAQVPLKPLFQEFTSATCGPCAYVNKRIDPIFHANESTHSLIKYQVDWPGAGDPYFIPQNRVRTDYYNVEGVPNLFVNDLFIEEPANMTQASYEEYLNETTFLEIDIRMAQIDANNMVNIFVDLKALEDYEEGLKAHIIILEKTTN